MLVTDTVFEYRSYGLVGLWGFFLGWAVPLGTPLWDVAVCWLLTVWMVQSFRRARFYESELAWWEQAWKESPRKTRTQLHYSEKLMEDIHSRHLAGEPWDSKALQADMARVSAIQDEFVRQGPNLQ